MLILNKNILTIGGNRLEGGPLTPPEPPGPSFDEVTIGTQTWMSKNLAIDDGGEGIVIKENVTANGVNFGTVYYYTKAAALRVASSIDGWHLPGTWDYVNLINYIGTNAASKLCSTSGWNNTNGTDDYGFTALPTGRIHINYLNEFNSLGSRCYLGADGNSQYSAYYIEPGDSDYGGNDYFIHPVRLIKDT